MQIQETIMAKMSVSMQNKNQKIPSQSFDQIFAQVNRIEEPIKQEYTNEYTNEPQPIAEYEDYTPEYETMTEEVTEQDYETIEYEYDTEIIAEEIIAVIAAALYVPAEIIEEWLIAYEIEPEEMLEPENTVKLIQAVLDAETPIELLTEPAYPEMIKIITEALEPYKALEIVKPTAEITGGVEVINEDGEVVVTPEPIELITEIQEPETTQQTVQQTTNQAETTDRPETVIPETEIITQQDAISLVNEIRTTADIALRQAIQQPAPIDNTDIINQIMSQVRVVSQGGNFTEMRLTLRPESLGDIQLRLITIAGIVTAQFTADSQRVKELLESSFNNLRDALTQQGIQFADISVSVRQEGSEAANQFEQARRNTRQRAESITEIEEIEPQADLDSGNLVSLTA